MGKIYNWGIIGLGKIAHKFASDLDKLPQANLQAVASRSEEKAREFAFQYGANRFYGSYDKMLEDGNLDVVYVATVHIAHCDIAVKCLQAGIAVLCEKPFAVNSREVQKMIAAAKKNEVFLMEAFWTRFLPTILKTQELIDNGRIGRLRSIKADFGFKADFKPEGRLLNLALGGGALLDIGIYPVFLALLLMGKPEKIRSLAHLGSTGVDEEIGMLFHYVEGQMAHLHASIRTNTKTEAFIYGDEGVIHIQTRWHAPASMNLWRYGERPENFQFFYKGIGYYFEAEEVMRSLDEGKLESDLLPLSFSEDLMSVLDSIRAEIGLQYEADVEG